MHKYLSINEMAMLLQVSRQTIYNRIKAGTAPKHIRIGDRYLFEVPTEEKQP